MALTFSPPCAGPSAPDPSPCPAAPAAGPFLREIRMTHTTDTATAADAIDPNVIVLETPIKRGEEVIRSIRLRKPSAGDLRGIKLHDLAQMDVTAITTVLPRISQPLLTMNDAAKLEPADLIEVARVMSDFFVPNAEKVSPAA